MMDIGVSEHALQRFSFLPYDAIMRFNGKSKNEIDKMGPEEAVSTLIAVSALDS